MQTLFTSGYIKALKFLAISEAVIVPFIQIKILEIILDQKSNYKAHIAYTFKKGIIAELALKKLKNLYFETI